MKTYIAFLRGINVSGHHKVPMADLRAEMEKMKFKNVVTILNSGNVIFDAKAGDAKQLGSKITKHLEKKFGFPIPTVVRSAKLIEELIASDPFKGIELTKDLRFYISLLWQETESDLKLPWTSEDGSFKILMAKDENIISVLDLSIGKTVKGMAMLEKEYGKKMTTRNWNTIKRIEKKLAES